MDITTRDGSLKEIGVGLIFCHDVLRNGRQRQGAAAPLELAVRQPGQPLFEVRAPGCRQQQMLRKNR
jgi:hypothetical protein